jgi:hypothetical protein
MRSRSAAFAILAALFVACLPPADAAAQASKKKAAVKAAPVKAAPEWRFVRRLSMPTLVYGANADDFQLSLSCQPDTGLLRVIAHIGSRGLQPGDDAAIRLANGKNRFEVAGTAFSTELSKVDVGGATRFDPGLFVLFKEGETLVVEVPGRKRSLPIADAGKSADAFLKACTATAAAKQAPAG